MPHDPPCTSHSTLPHLAASTAVAALRRLPAPPCREQLRVVRVCLQLAAAGGAVHLPDAIILLVLATHGQSRCLAVADVHLPVQDVHLPVQVGDNERCLCDGRAYNNTASKAFSVAFAGH